MHNPEHAGRQFDLKDPRSQKLAIRRPTFSSWTTLTGDKGTQTPRLYKYLTLKPIIYFFFDVFTSSVYIVV